MRCGFFQERIALFTTPSDIAKKKKKRKADKLKQSQGTDEETKLENSPTGECLVNNVNSWRFKNTLNDHVLFFVAGPSARLNHIKRIGNWKI